MENKYHNSKIYAVKNVLNEKIYIGSTTIALSKRMVKHRCDAKQRCCDTRQDEKEDLEAKDFAS